MARRRPYSPRQGEGIPQEWHATTIRRAMILLLIPVTRLAGLILYHYRALMYEFGLTVANAWGSITYSHHLYNALRREGLI